MKDSKGLAWDNQKLWGVSIFIAIVSATLLCVHLFPPPLNAGLPHIEAPPYSWPRGCADKDYTEDDRIAWECANRQNLLTKYGLFYLPSSRGGHYYRVGDDAISISCGFSDTCRVDHIYKNAFHR